MKTVVMCKVCVKKPHPIYYICSKCGNRVMEPILSFWNEEDLARQRKDNPEWKYCPICGEPLYGEEE